MSTDTPWRIASQRYTVLNAEKEPIVTLEFIHYHGDASRAFLRIVPFDATQDAHEVTFATGGYVENAVMQPRWLRPFERVDPNLYLDDEEAAQAHHNGLPSEQQAAWMAKRDAMLARREAFADPPDPADAEFTDPEEAPKTKVDPKAHKVHA